MMWKELTSCIIFQRMVGTLPMATEWSSTRWLCLKTFNQVVVSGSDGELTLIKDPWLFQLLALLSPSVTGNPIVKTNISRRVCAELPVGLQVQPTGEIFKLLLSQPHWDDIISNIISQMFCKKYRTQTRFGAPAVTSSSYNLDPANQQLRSNGPIVLNQQPKT